VTPRPTQALSSASRSRRAVGARVATLFDEHAAMVLGLCRLLLRDHHEAEDAAQQTFVSAYRSLLRGTEPRDAGPWLAAIARNECRARLRKRARAPLTLDGDVEIEISDGEADLAEVADRRAELAQLAAEIAKLPIRQREAIALRDFLGLSYEEVASTLKVSVPVVESLLFRARRRLRDTVRTVPRYAAGIVIVPIALRAAVAREVPDFDGVTLGLVAAGVAGAAAAGASRLLSLTPATRVAATVAIVATGAVFAPKLFDAVQPSAAPPAAVAVEPRDGIAPAAAPVEDAPAGAAPAPSSSDGPAAPEPRDDPAPAPAANEDEPGQAADAPAASGEDAAPAEDAPVVGDGRVSSSTGGGGQDLPVVPPPPPPPPAEECPEAPAQASADGGEPDAEPEPKPGDCDAEGPAGEQPATGEPPAEPEIPAGDSEPAAEDAAPSEPAPADAGVPAA
jgi:RNA polymerase sigma-70 factor (ECF subfamily)